MMAVYNSAPFFILSAFILLVSHLRIETMSQLLPIADSGSNGSAIETQTYIVTVDGIEDSDLLSYEDRESWYMSFLPNTTLDSGEPRLLHSYEHVINGFAARLTREELKAMESMDGFVGAQLSHMRRLGTTYTPQFLELNKYGNSIWAKSSGGEGIIIGVIDSGIVKDHPSFDDSGMPPPPAKWRGCCQFTQKSCSKFTPSVCNNKILGARSYVGGSPADTSGHGSHVASIAAGSTVYDADVLGQAKGTASGMAPRAHLAVYKACTASGCDDANVLMAIDHAINDGVDVLSMSIVGGFLEFYDDGVMRGGFSAMANGIFSSACAGNEGRIPLKISNDAPWLLTVGASTTDRVMRVVVQLGNGMEMYGESGYQPENYTSPWLSLDYPGARIATDNKKACKAGSLDDEDVAGKMVVCEQGISERTDKGRFVKKAQGAALLVLNPNWDGFTTMADDHVLPAAHLSHVDSRKVFDYYKTDPNPRARLLFRGTQFGQRRAPAVISLSSRGPSTINRGILKPDIIGPGSDILGAWANTVGPDPHAPSTTAFSFATGCSMATPHLAGIAALIKSMHNDWSPSAIKSAIMTTANTLDHDGLPIVDEKSNTLEPATYFAMGAGHVNPSKAMDPGLIYDVHPDDYIRYLCSLYNDYQVKLIVKRSVTCHSLISLPAEQLNQPSIMVSLASSSVEGAGSVKEISRTVTYVGDDASADFRLEDVVQPAGTIIEIDPKELHFSSPKETKTFTVKIITNGSTPDLFFFPSQFQWVSDKHVVTSPISFQFQV